MEGKKWDASSVLGSEQTLSEQVMPNYRGAPLNGRMNLERERGQVDIMMKVVKPGLGRCSCSRLGRSEVGQIWVRGWLWFPTTSEVVLAWQDHAWILHRLCCQRTSVSSLESDYGWLIHKTHAVHRNENQGRRKGATWEKCVLQHHSQAPPCCPQTQASFTVSSGQCLSEPGEGQTDTIRASTPAPDPQDGSQAAVQPLRLQYSHPGCRRLVSAREFWFDVAGLLLFHNAAEDACETQGSHLFSPLGLTLGPEVSVWGHL